MSVVLENVRVTVRKETWLHQVSLVISPGEQWAFVGSNGSGKSVLGRVLSGELPASEGLCQLRLPAALVSFEELGDVLQFEREHDDSDFLDRVDHGTVVRTFIGGDNETVETLARQIGCQALLERGMRFLSTGEMRKVMILRALVQKPRLLILDEPFDGLDADSRQALKLLVADWMTQGGQVVLMVNRFSDLVPQVTHLAYLQDGSVLTQGRREEVLQQEVIVRLRHFDALEALHLPECEAPLPPLPDATGQPLIAMNHVTVRYTQKLVLNQLTWQVQPGQHWKISGPNGSGKSTLLSLISGENPQAYANDIVLFGRAKGSGESVWDIKRHLGQVSALFHQEYRVRVTVLTTVLSGFYDSVGLYQTPSRRQQQIARQWLEILGIEQKANLPFRRLSYGEQRLVLLARAMVKQPRVLILDEPCQGLDEVHRHLVLALIDYLGRQGRTQLLYVTHHEEDRIPCIQHHLRLVPAASGGFTAQVIC